MGWHCQLAIQDLQVLEIRYLIILGSVVHSQRGLGTFLLFHGILDISGFCQILDHEFELIQG